MSANMPTETRVREWLLGYAWLGPAERDARIVNCIISQENWKHVSAVADKYAGAQFEPGPAAFDEGVQFALSALYECHAGPHIPACPYAEEEK